MPVPEWTQQLRAARQQCFELFLGARHIAIDRRLARCVEDRFATVEGDRKPRRTRRPLDAKADRHRRMRAIRGDGSSSCFEKVRESSLARHQESLKVPPSLETVTSHWPLASESFFTGKRGRVSDSRRSLYQSKSRSEEYGTAWFFIAWSSERTFPGQFVGRGVRPRP